MHESTSSHANHNVHSGSWGTFSLVHSTCPLVAMVVTPKREIYVVILFLLCEYVWVILCSACINLYVCTIKKMQRMVLILYCKAYRALWLLHTAQCVGQGEVGGSPGGLLCTWQLWKDHVWHRVYFSWHVKVGVGIICYKLPVIQAKSVLCKVSP